MARVTGIGGVFLRSADPARLKQWYAEHLGVKLTAFGGVKFLWSDEIPAGTGVTVWSTFPENTTYFGDGAADVPQQVMINYRVDDLHALLAALQAAEVWIDPKRDDSEFGKFAWIRDCDGNRVELWEPPAAAK